MIVLDASSAVCVLLNSPVDRAARIRERLRGEELQAPHLIDLEVAHALRRMVLIGDLTSAGAEEALNSLAWLEVDRHPHYPFLGDIWRMRSNRTAYDAAYVALAEFLRAPLITLDGRMARTPSAATIEVF